MLTLKRQLQTTSGLSETSGPTSSLLSIANNQPLFSYSLYGTTTTSPTNFLHTYPSTLSYHGNSSYTSSYTSQQPSYGGLLLGQPTSYNPVTSSYGYNLTTTSETGPLNLGYKYQTSITTTSPILTNMSTKFVTMDTVEKSRDQVTMDTTEKDRNEQDGVHTTEATLMLPDLVDNTQQVPPKPTGSHG